MYIIVINLLLGILFKVKNEIIVFFRNPNLIASRCLVVVIDLQAIVLTSFISAINTEVKGDK